MDYIFVTTGTPNSHNALIRDSVSKILRVANDKIEWIILFGSYSRDEQRIDSDIDLCVYLDMDKNDRFTFRKEIIGVLGDIFDVQTFQDLPVTVRMEVLKGKVLYCKDPSFLYDVAYETIKDFNLFERSYKLFLGIGD